MTDSEYKQAEAQSQETEKPIQSSSGSSIFELRQKKLTQIDQVLGGFNYQATTTEDIQQIQKQREQDYQSKVVELEAGLGIKLGAESADIIRQNIVDDTIERAQSENSKYKSLAEQKNILQDLLEVDEPIEKVEIPPVDGLVFSEKAFLAPDSDFEGATETTQIPAAYMRPIFIGERGKTMTEGSVETAIDVKSTIAMGKAACIECPIKIDNIEYNFVQWKGVGANPVNEKAPNRAIAEGGRVSFPLGQDSAMPFFVLEVKGKTLVRFMGGAYFEDLLLEAEKSKIMEQYGLRMPKIISTIKFSKEFCAENNLPLPKNDDPTNYEGASLREFIEANQDNIEPELYKKMMASYEAGDYESAILGQNVRAFKNVWRVSEIEEAIKETDETKKKENISAIFRTSQEVFTKEFGVEMDENQFIERFASLLGKQVAILLENNLLQGAMKNLKQDITLAGEICDFDGAYQLTEEYLADDSKRPKWVTDEATQQEWKQEKQQELYRQILFVGAHIKPIIEAANQIKQPQNEERIVDIFVTEILRGMSDKSQQDLLEFINNSEKFQSIDDIAGDDQMTHDNLGNYQQFFNLIVEKIKST